VALERDFEEYEAWSLAPNAQSKYTQVEGALHELAGTCDAGGYQMQNALKNNGVMDCLTLYIYICI